jgi:hypothetical protein
MSFLAPLFLLGGLAIALPVIFHLIRRTSKERVPFSSLMFLQPTPPRVTRRSRLENILLLILRCLVLLLLALGFARPFLQRPMAAGGDAQQGQRMVILVDASASMHRENLWPEARAKAESWLAKTGPADSIALVAFDRVPRTLVSFEQWRQTPVSDRAVLARQRLNEAAPGWAATHLGNALLGAVEMIEETSRRNTATVYPAVPRRLVVITDLQQGARLDGLQGYEWPKGLEVVVETLKPKKPTNAGLALVAEREEIEKSGAAAVPRLRVSNAPNSKREQFQFGWARPGDKGITGVAVDAYVPPGQNRIMSAPALVEGLPPERLLLTGDDEDFDNTIWRVPPRAEQVSIVFLGNEAETDPAMNLFYARRAFQETLRQVARVVSVGSGTNVPDAELDAAALAVVTDPLDETRVASLRRFLDAGKTVLVVMKSPALAPFVAKLAGLGVLPAEEAAVRNYALLGQIDFAHPVFAPFADPRFGDFTKIHFWKHRRLGLDAVKDARVLAKFDDGDPALAALPAGRGNLLVLTSGWHPADSQLALSTKFVPLLYSVLELSGGLKAQAAQYFVGDAVPLTLSNATAAVTVRKPDGREARVTPGSPFAETDLPGIYMVNGTEPPVRWAVNLDPAESQTAPLPLEDLERLGVPLKIQAVAMAKVEEARKERLQAAELESRQKLWRWLLVATLLLLLVETFAAGWITRRMTRPAA